jgi:outer membrane lipoprotein-sorting protein
VYERRLTKGHPAEAPWHYLRERKIRETRERQGVLEMHIGTTALRIALAAALALGGLAGAAAQEQSPGGQPDFGQMLATIDESNRFEEHDFSCTYTIVSTKPDEGKEVTQAKMFRRDREDKFVLVILKPKVQRGQGYLQLGDNLWFYDPDSRKFSHTSLKENIQNSDAKNSDLRGSSLAEDYRVNEWDEGQLGRYPVYILTLEAVHDEVAYPKLKLWIRRDVPVVLKGENYSLSGRLMRTAYYPSYTKLGDKYVADKMLFIDNLKEGERTQVTLDQPSIEDVPDHVFTKSYLERVNR